MLLLLLLFHLHIMLHISFQFNPYITQMIFYMFHNFQLNTLNNYLEFFHILHIYLNINYMYYLIKNNLSHTLGSLYFIWLFHPLYNDPNIYNKNFLYLHLHTYNLHQLYMMNNHL